ncbi:hypothetical protein SRB5_64380 [Streptomyces sp. RB5]|uniref:DNRLRE domain-containing protein n=1 Tax=Streptomyces smaragdinus TaxID=2585196 RepID=A0A7K0CS36_9ACTN|nr:DNRLRE domain-containing protein [Streptomyces smaragdinus]MQY16240.1 hypothetical protein [Streptomyces smaragdinus]
MIRRWRPRKQRAVAWGTVIALAAGLGYAGLVHHDQPGHHAQADPRLETVVTEAQAAVRAAKTNKRVEATALRTAYTTTWARPDGLFQRDIHSSPIRAQVGGQWKAIDPTLAKSAQGWSPKATNVGMVFSPGARAPQRRADRSAVTRLPLGAPEQVTATGNPLVTLTVGGHDIVLTWPEAIPAPIIDGPRALYPDIIPGADLVLTADDLGFAQLLVVKTRAAAADPRVAQLRYGLSSPDLSFTLDPVTGVLSANDPSDETVATSPTPLMWDSAGDATLTDGQAGSTAAPAPEVLSSDPPGGESEESGSPTGSPGPGDVPADGDNGDVYDEGEPLPGDETPEPGATAESPAPPVPGEPTPDPSHTGAATTLDLPGLDGPQPDSRGTVPTTDLDGPNWTVTPDMDFLNDPATEYPVFIDPSVKKHTNDWTTAYSRHPKATFYNGKGFNKGGTHEARVGFESDTWGTSRSYFTIDWDQSLKGSTVYSATLRALETYSWSCSARTMNVYLTGAISSKTNWSNAPAMTSANKLGSKSFAHGYKSASCPDEYVAFDVKSAAQKAVAGSGAKSMTIGFRAGDESSQYSWKKFQADGGNDPYVELVYNRRPSAPTSLDLDPERSCDTTAPYINVSNIDLTFWASTKDQDANLSSVRFELWPTGGSTTNLLGSKATVSVGSQKATARVHTDPFDPTSADGNAANDLKNGTTYSWRARSMDTFGASSGYSPASTPCRFVFDTARPAPPTVTSTQFPDADGNNNGFLNEDEDANWSTVKFGTAGSFTFKASQTDVVRYEYGFNSPDYPFSITRTNGAATSTLTTASNVKPQAAGPNVLFVRAVDDAGNVSEPTKYFFYLTPRDKADSPGDFTGDDLPDLMVIDGTGALRLYANQGTVADPTKGSGDLDYSMSGAYLPNPQKDPNGDDLPVYTAPPTGYWKNTLITHLGDVYGGDGLQDIVAVREGKLWVYPGDGYGAVNIDKRQEILLPANAPAPSTITQIVSAGDATGDGKTDFFATVGNTLWVFVGYNGATIEQAQQINPDAWPDRDIVTVQDITGDGVTDLLFRTTTRLMLRKGKPAAGGGVDLESLGTAAASADGIDTVYGASGWGPDTVRLLFGTPDANGDNIPDFWALRVDYSVRFYPGSRTAITGNGVTVVGNSDGVGWKNKLAIG